MSNLNVFAVGSSRNIGYFTCVRLLDAGATVTFLLRSPSAFDNDATIQKYISSGKAKLVKGDALAEDDCRRGWNIASSNVPVDYLLFTVGGTPQFTLTKGFMISPPNLVTQSFLNVIATKPNNVKIVTVTSLGLTTSAHEALPWVLKPMYTYLLDVPGKDKMGVERAIAHFSGLEWDSRDGEPSEDIIGKDWQSRPGLPSAGSLHDIVVVRPAVLTDGECLAEKNTKELGYRTSTEELGGYTISRKDVAHFVAGIILESWSQWQGKRVNVGY